MRLARFDSGRIGVVQGDTLVDLTEQLNSVAAYRPGEPGDPLIAALPQWQPRLKELLAQGASLPIDSVRLESPVAMPSKIIAIGRSYVSHIEEAKRNADVFHSGDIPLDVVRMIMKANTALTGPAKGVWLRFPERRTDPELEFTIVIGRRASCVSQEQALDFVAGYSLGLDITLRGPEPPSQRKSIDTYAVVGPWMVTADEFGDPGNVVFQLAINDEVSQRATTADLRFSLAEIVANASAHFTLWPGDLIMTGTPEGVRPVVPGDVLTASSSRIGSMKVAMHAFQPD